MGFFETNWSVGAKPQKSVQILWQIRKPLSITEILTPAVVGDQIKIVIILSPFFLTNVVITGKPSY